MANEDENKFIEEKEIYKIHNRRVKLKKKKKRKQANSNGLVPFSVIDVKFMPEPTLHTFMPEPTVHTFRKDTRKLEKDI